MSIKIKAIEVYVCSDVCMHKENYLKFTSRRYLLDLFSDIILSQKNNLRPRRAFLSRTTGWPSCWKRSSSFCPPQPTSSVSPPPASLSARSPPAAPSSVASAELTLHPSSDSR